MPTWASDDFERRVAQATVLNGLFGDEPLVTVGRYRLGPLLGRGAHGRVFAAQDPELDRTVAIKLLDMPGRDAGRALQEAQTLAQVSHPNVVAIYDAGVDDDRAYIVMERVDGERLERSADPKVTLLRWRQAGQGLAAAHAAGVVHRDFKADNVLVAADGTPKVADFGLARAAPTEPGSAGDPAATRRAGTPLYMAPEQHEGKGVDERSDQYAFCVGLWEALDGAPPFVGSVHSELLAAKRRGVAGRPAAGSRRVAAALRRGLQPDPRDRFASMADLLAAMETSRRGGLALGAAAIAGLGIAAWGLDDKPACDPITTPVTPDDLAGVRVAMVATGWSGAQQQAERVANALHEYADAWVTARTTACQAAAAAHRQATLACLDAAHLELDAVLSTLDGADVTVAVQAWSVVASLPPPEACLAPTPWTENEDAPKRLLERAAMQQRTGQRTVALALASEARAQAEALGRPEIAVQAQLIVAQVHTSAGDHATTRGVLEEALAAARTLDDPRPAVVARIGLAGNAADRHDFDAAAAWLDEAEPALVNAGDPPRLRAQWLAARARLLERRDDLDGALVLYDRALALEADELELSSLLSRRGLLHRDRDELDAAAADLEAALDLRRTILHPDHPRSFGVLLNLGLIRAAQGRHDAARDLLSRAYAIAELEGGQDSPNTLMAAANLGSLASATGDYATAATRFEQVLAARRSRHGADHASLALPSFNLGNALVDLGRPTEAVPHYERALRLLSRDLPPDHPRVATALTGLGGALRAAGDAHTAVEHLQRAHAIRGRTDATPAELAPTLGELALALRDAQASTEEVSATAQAAHEAYREAGDGSSSSYRLFREAWGEP